MSASNFLPAIDADQVRRGCCPRCHGVDFLPGPRGGLCRNVLCVRCFAEYNSGPIAVELLHEVCPQDRRAAVYRIL